MTLLARRRLVPALLAAALAAGCGGGGDAEQPRAPGSSQTQDRGDSGTGY